MEFDIIRSNRKTLAAQIKDGRLIIRAPIKSTDIEIESFIHKHAEWIECNLAKSVERRREKEACRRLTPEEVSGLMRRAEMLIPERVEHYAPIVGVSYGKVTIRNQRSRWGSCSSNGNLSFNCLLMLAPEKVIDSVVVHELCHRRAMNHSSRFYAEVLRVMPDYYIHYEWLRKNGDLLMAMNGV